MIKTLKLSKLSKETLTMIGAKTISALTLLSLIVTLSTAVPSLVNNVELRALALLTTFLSLAGIVHFWEVYKSSNLVITINTILIAFHLGIAFIFKGSYF